MFFETWGWSRKALEFVRDVQLSLQFTLHHIVHIWYASDLWASDDTKCLIRFEPITSDNALRNHRHVCLSRHTKQCKCKV